MRRNRRFGLFFSVVVFGALFTLNALPAAAQSDLILYTDSLLNGWQNWSWNSTTNVSNTTPVHSGADSVSVQYNAGYAGLYLAFPNGLNADTYASLTFWIHGGGTSAHNISVKAIVNGNATSGAPITNFLSGGAISANAWKQATVPLAALGASSGTITGFYLQEGSGSAQPVYYVDDIQLTAAAPPATVNLTINPGSVLQTADARAVGMNTAVWDDQLNKSGTISLLNAADIRTLRFPGGSTSDDYHWKTNTTDANTWTWATGFDAFANVVTQTHANVFITVNYGTGTAQEAAGWVTYANQTKNLGIKYWEIGNECYGSWETDSNTRPHDPVTYATRAAQYISAMKAVDPTIKTGVVVVTGEDSYANYSSSTDPYATNPRTGVKHYGWTPLVLTTLKNLGVTPDYIIYHRYDQGPGGENDAALLQVAASWPNDAANLRQQLTDYLGANGAKVELTCTENNSVYSNPGKQTTSLVNGLFMADSVGNLLKTEFKTVIWWDLRNGQDSSNNNSASLYGWRQYGDYGIMSAANDCYSTYYISKLLSKFARGGDQIVTATSNYGFLSVYAAKRTDGSITALVINKSPISTLNGTLNFAQNPGRLPVGVTSYGIPQDNAAQTGTGSRDIATSTANWPASGALTYNFAPYSATVLSFPPTATVTGRIALEGVSNLATINAQVPLGTFHIGFRNPNTTTEIYAADVTLTPVGGGSAYGTFNLSGAPRGTFDIGVKGSKQLRTVLHTIAVSATTTLPAVTLSTGDANNDNSVDVSDFGLFINSYSGLVSDLTSGYDARCDLNYDGSIDVGDFGLLINDYGAVGDP